MADTESIKGRIEEDVKSAMRSKDKERLATLRLIRAAIKQREVDERIELDDAQVLAVLEKMIKQRRDSIEQYRGAGREELAAKEEAEIGVIEQYMPARLDEAEVDAIIDEVIAATGAASAKDMGKVMGALKARLQGRADMGAASAKVKARLST
jgi:uncharacterized protein YqeY